MIFPWILIATVTLTDGTEREGKLAMAHTEAQCEQIGETYIALGPVFPKELVVSATMRCENIDDEAAPDEHFNAEGQKVPGAAL